MFADNMGGLENMFANQMRGISSMMQQAEARMSAFETSMHHGYPCAYMQPNTNVVDMPGESMGGMPAMMAAMNAQTQAANCRGVYANTSTAFSGPQSAEPQTSAHFANTMDDVRHQIREGSEVIIHDLNSVPELNGTKGTCLQWHPDKSRWDVRVHTDRVLAIKPEKLKLASEVGHDSPNVSTSEYATYNAQSNHNRTGSQTWNQSSNFQNQRASFQNQRADYARKRAQFVGSDFQNQRQDFQNERADFASECAQFGGSQTNDERCLWASAGGSDDGWSLVAELKRLVHASDMEKLARRFGDASKSCSAAALKEAISCTPHSSTKMKIIEAVAPGVFGDWSVVIDALTHASDKEKARKLLSSRVHACSRASASSASGGDSGWNLVSELKSLVHASDMEKAARRFGAANLSCSAAALKEAISYSPHSSTKMKIIEAVAPGVFGDFHVVIDALTHASDKRKATELLRKW